MKKVLSYFILLLVAFFVVACKDEPCTEHVDSNNDKKCDVCGADIPANPPEEYHTDAEAFDLGGQKVRIFTKRAADYDYEFKNPLDPTKLRNDDENTAYWSIVERTTKYIENKYNCDIEWVDGLTVVTESNVWTHLQNVYATGKMYDIVSITGEEFPYMYMNGMVQELPEDYFDEKVTSLFWGGEDGFQYSAYKHLDKKWGVGGSNNIYDIKNTATDNAYSPVLFYNIDMLKSAGITKMPGEYYEEGTWSWDVFEEMMETVVENIPGVSGLVDAAYSAGIQTMLGANNTFVFDDYGNMGFYSEKAQAVYSKWNEWYDAKLIRNYTYEKDGNKPDEWYNQRWFMNGECAFISGRMIFAQNYFKDLNYSIVPYPFGPAAALATDPTKIDNNKFNYNVYTTGYFWSVPKGKDLRCYQLLAEFYGGLKEYYLSVGEDVDDVNSSIEEVFYQLFDSEDETALKLLKEIQEKQNFLIIQSAVPSGIFRQAIREHYWLKSDYHGQMYPYMISRQGEIAPDNPNNFWKCIFGEPGNTAQS